MMEWLSSGYKELNEELEKVKNGFNQLGEKYSIIKNDMVKFKEENSIIKNDTVKLKEENSILKNDMVKLKEENSILKNDKVKLKEENSILKNGMVKMREENSILKNDMFKLKEENSILKNGMVKMKEGNSILKNEMFKLKKDLEKINENPFILIISKFSQAQAKLLDISLSFPEKILNFFEKYCRQEKSNYFESLLEVLSSLKKDGTELRKIVLDIYTNEEKVDTKLLKYKEPLFNLKLFLTDFYDVKMILNQKIPNDSKDFDEFKITEDEKKKDILGLHLLCSKKLKELKDSNQGSFKIYEDVKKIIATVEGCLLFHKSNGTDETMNVVNKMLNEMKKQFIDESKNECNEFPFF